MVDPEEEVSDNDIVELLLEGNKVKPLARELGVSEWRVRRVKQQMMDVGRIGRRNDRAEHRAESSVLNLQEGILHQLKRIGKPLSRRKKSTRKPGAKAPVGILHLSDLHLGETISIESNRFDFDVAAQRLSLFVDRAKLYFTANQVERVVVCFGGDILNSDRHREELLENATNRSRSVVISSHLLAHVVADLHDDFVVDAVGVTGNEGRANKELGWADLAASDNYDATCFWMIKSLLEDRGSDLTFHDIQANEVIFEAHGLNFLLIHGHQINMGDQKKVQSLIGKIASSKGITINMVLAGHIHSTLIADIASRNSSLSGSNAFSDEGLGFSSKAAQNIHIVHPDSRIEGIKIDLQNAEEAVPYETIAEAHYAKSSRATKTGIISI